MVPPNSYQVPRDWHYLGKRRESSCFRLRGYHALWPNFPEGSSNKNFFDSLPLPQPGRRSPRPRVRNGCVLTRIRFGLFPFRSPLLGESNALSIPQGTKMFQFPWFATYAYEFSIRSQVLNLRGCPIRKSPDQKLLSASPELIAATPRPSSLPAAKASTAHP